MGLTFVVAVMIFGSFNRLGCKIKFTRNKKMVEVGGRLGSWNYGESFENKDAILHDVLGGETVENSFKRGRLSVHSSAI